jgi:hypothetical protein
MGLERKGCNHMDRIPFHGPRVTGSHNWDRPTSKQRGSDRERQNRPAATPATKIRSYKSMT